MQDIYTENMRSDWLRWCLKVGGSGWGKRDTAYALQISAI